MLSMFRVFALLLSTFISLVIISCSDSEKEKKPGPLKADNAGYVDPPPVRTYPSGAADIQKWIDDLDQEKIRAHGWDIWESITSETEAGGPVWETWYSGHEIFELDTAGVTKLNQVKSPERNFEFPHQFISSNNRNDIPVDEAEVPTSFNRYTKSLAYNIWDNGYNKKKVLDSINNYFNANNTPVVQRQISTSTDSVDALSFALKPVFQFISKDSATAVPYWAGISPSTTTDLINPEPHTWRQAVIVDPTGKLKPGTTHMMSVNGEPPQEWPVVSLDNFFYIQLTKAEAENFSQFAAESGDDVGHGNMSDTAAIYDLVKEGNYALLTAMHVTGKEIVDWTWQTFWWSPDNQNPVYGKDRPKSIAAPWSNYNMNTAYYMVAPDNAPINGEPLIAFNPYLETNLFGKVAGGIPGDSISWYGVFSNCMSCHRLAAYPNNFYTSDGNIDPADSAIFSNLTKTDFLWSIPTRAD